MLKFLTFLLWDAAPSKGIEYYRLASKFDPDKDMIDLEWSREDAFSKCSTLEKEYLDSRLEH